MAMVILFASVKRFSASLMRDFFFNIKLALFVNPYWFNWVNLYHTFTLNNFSYLPLLTQINIYIYIYIYIYKPFC